MGQTKMNIIVLGLNRILNMVLVSKGLETDSTHVAVSRLEVRVPLCSWCPCGYHPSWLSNPHLDLVSTLIGAPWVTGVRSRADCVLMKIMPLVAIATLVYVEARYGSQLATPISSNMETALYS